MRFPDLASFSATHAPVIATLHRRGDAERWNVSLSALAEALHRSASHRFPDGAQNGEVARYLLQRDPSEYGWAAKYVD